jgi:hypothetical protein
MDSDLAGKIIVALVAIAAVIFDWPRALAGLAVGYAGRRSGYPMIAIPAGVVAVSAIGEVIYSVIGRTSGMGWGSFLFGLIAAGATAYGIHRVLFNLYDS